MKTLRDILDWWVAQLRDCLPSSLAGHGVESGDAILVEATPGAAGHRVLRRHRQREMPLGWIADDAAAARRLLQGRRSAPVLLRLPDERLLQREMTLPAAAASDLRQVLGFELDRVTPFQPDEVYWGWRIEARDKARLRLRLVLVPRAGLQAVMLRLAQAGVVARGIVGTTPGGPPGFALAAGEAAGQGRGMALLASLCAVLAAGVLALPFGLRLRALDQAESRIAQLRPQLAEVERLRARIEEGSSGAGLFAAEAARLGSPLQALAALTASLPDGTFLTALALRQKVLTVSGQSTAAAGLIATLAASAALRDPSFTAPVTRAGDGRADVFSLRVELGS